MFNVCFGGGLSLSLSNRLAPWPVGNLYMEITANSGGNMKIPAKSDGQRILEEPYGAVVDRNHSKSHVTDDEDVRSEFHYQTSEDGYEISFVDENREVIRTLSLPSDYKNFHDNKSTSELSVDINVFSDCNSECAVDYHRGSRDDVGDDMEKSIEYSIEFIDEESKVKLQMIKMPKSSLKKRQRKLITASISREEFVKEVSKSSNDTYFENAKSFGIIFTNEDLRMRMRLALLRMMLSNAKDIDPSSPEHFLQEKTAPQFVVETVEEEKLYNYLIKMISWRFEVRIVELFRKTSGREDRFFSMQPLSLQPLEYSYSTEPGVPRYNRSSGAVIDRDARCTQHWMPLPYLSLEELVGQLPDVNLVEQGEPFRTVSLFHFGPCKSILSASLHDTPHIVTGKICWKVVSVETKVSPPAKLPLRTKVKSSSNCSKDGITFVVTGRPCSHIPKKISQPHDLTKGEEELSKRESALAITPKPSPSLCESESSVPDNVPSKKRTKRHATIRRLKATIRRNICCLYLDDCI